MSQYNDWGRLSVFISPAVVIRHLVPSPFRISQASWGHQGFCGHNSKCQAYCSLSTPVVAARIDTGHLHMQAELGDIVYVELPEAGSEVEKGNNFGVVESVKVHTIQIAS